MIPTHTPILAQIHKLFQNVYDSFTKNQNKKFTLNIENLKIAVIKKNQEK